MSSRSPPKLNCCEREGAHKGLPYSMRGDVNGRVVNAEEGLYPPYGTCVWCYAGTSSVSKSSHATSAGVNRVVTAAAFSANSAAVRHPTSGKTFIGVLST